MCLRRLGSRLYYDFTAQALGDATSWERLADSVAVEVRRHAPSATAVAVPASTPPHTLAPGGAAAAPTPTALSTVSEPRGEAALTNADGGATPGVSVSSTVHYNNYSNSNSSSSNSFKHNNKKLKLN